MILKLVFTWQILIQFSSEFVWWLHMDQVHDHIAWWVCIGRGSHSADASWDSLLVEGWTRDQKVVSSDPGRSGGRIFFSGLNFLCWLLFSVRSTPVLPQRHEKDPSHSAKSAGGRFHLNILIILTQQSWSGLTMPLSRHSKGTYQETTSSLATLQGTLSHSRSDPGIKNEISVQGLIATLKKERTKSTGRE